MTGSRGLGASSETAPVKRRRKTGCAVVVVFLALLLSSCGFLDPGPVAPMTPDDPHVGEFPLSGERERVAYRVVVEVNEEAAVYDTAMIPWGGRLVVVPPSRPLPDDEDAPDSAEVLNQLAVYASPVVGGRAATERRTMADLSPGGLIEVRPWPPPSEPCEPSASCRREYLVEFFRLTATTSPYSVEWRSDFNVRFDEMGLKEPDGAELHVNVEPWNGPLPSPPPIVGPTPTPDAGAPSP